MDSFKEKYGVELTQDISIDAPTKIFDANTPKTPTRFEDLLADTIKNTRTKKSFISSIFNFFNKEF